jgi:hypothetical protein
MARRANKGLQACKECKVKLVCKANKDRLDCVVLRVLKEFAVTPACKESKEHRVLRVFKELKEQLVCRDLRVFKGRKEFKE